MLVLGAEVRLAEGRLRADILAMDPEGAVVIVELKRGADRDQHMQAVGYAAQLWASERIAEPMGRLGQFVPRDRFEGASPAFLRVSPHQLNRKQRILLVAEDYYLTTLRTVLFLTEQYGLDITLCRIGLYKFADGRYLMCERVCPEMELDEANNYAPVQAGPPDLDSTNEVASVVAKWGSPSLAAFVRDHGAAVHVRTTNQGLTFFPCASGRRVRFALDQRVRTIARVLQDHRFTGDVEYWRRFLPDIELREKDRKKGLGKDPLEWLVPDEEHLAAFLSGLVGLPQES